MIEFSLGLLVLSLFMASVVFLDKYGEDMFHPIIGIAVIYGLFKLCCWIGSFLLTEFVEAYVWS